MKYDPRNLSRVYLRDPTGRHWRIPYADLRQPPIALWELEEAKKRLRQHGMHTHAEQAIFANILEQRRIVRDAATLSKERRRREKTPHDVAVLPLAVDQLQKPKAIASDLKPYPVEIWEGE